MADVKINVKVITSGALKAVRGLNTLTKNATKSFDSLGKSVKTTGSSFKSFFLADLAASAVKSLAGSVLAFGKTSLNTAKNLETIATQFEVLTGSAAEANAIVKDLTDFAAKTPFRFEGIAKAGARLLSFGFAADDIKDKLQVLGDVAGASGTDIGELSLIFGQVRAAGKLTGERLLQLQERAIPIGPAIAKSMGVTESAVRDLVKNGKVDFAEFEKAFESLNNEGSFAFEGLEKRSQTLEGRLSTLAEDVELLGASVFGAFVPALKAGAAVLSELLSQFRTGGDIKDFTNQIQVIIPQAIRFTAEAFSGLINIVQDTRQALNIITAGFNSFAVSLVDGTVKVLEAVVATKEFLGLDTSGLDKTISNLKDVSSTFEEVGVNALESNIKIENSQLKLVSTIEGTTDRIVSKYNEELAAADTKANATVAANEKEIASVQKKFNIIQLLNEQAVASADEFAANETLANELRGQASFDQLVLGLGTQEAAKVAARAKELENEGKHKEALKVLAEANTKSQKAQADAAAKLRAKDLKDRDSFFSTAASLSSSGNKTLAAIGKAGALAQLAIKTPEAVASSFAFGTKTGGPALGFILGGIAAVAMAAQAAQIVGAGFQDGGIVGGSSFSGDNVPARVNSGEMILNRQQQGQLFSIANGGGGRGGQTIQSNITVELDGEVVGRAVSRQVADGLELGEVV